MEKLKQMMLIYEKTTMVMPTGRVKGPPRCVVPSPPTTIREINMPIVHTRRLTRRRILLPSITDSPTAVIWRTLVIVLIVKGWTVPTVKILELALLNKGIRKVQVFSQEVLTGLRKDDSVRIPELNAINLLCEHRTARVNELASLDWILEQGSPCRLCSHFPLHSDLVINNFHVVGRAVARHRAINLLQC